MRFLGEKNRYWTWHNEDLHIFYTAQTYKSVSVTFRQFVASFFWFSKYFSAKFVIIICSEIYTSLSCVILVFNFDEHVSEFRDPQANIRNIQYFQKMTKLMDFCRTLSNIQYFHKMTKHIDIWWYLQNPCGYVLNFSILNELFILLYSIHLILIHSPP